MSGDKVGYFTLKRLAGEAGPGSNVGFGALWKSPIPGVYNVSLSLPVINENGTKYYKKVVAVKLEGETKGVDLTGAFINLNIEVPLEAREPYDR